MFGLVIDLFTYDLSHYSPIVLGKFRVWWPTTDIFLSKFQINCIHAAMNLNCDFVREAESGGSQTESAKKGAPYKIRTQRICFSCIFGELCLCCMM